MIKLADSGILFPVKRRPASKVIYLGATFFAATAAVLTFFAVFGPSAAAAPFQQDILLLKIDKTAAATLSNAFWQNILGVSELESLWLVLAKRVASDSQKAQNAGFEVLDVDPADKAYFYVGLSEPEDIAELGRLGDVRALEARTALFWAGTAEAREIIPAKFRLARVVFVPAAASPLALDSRAAMAVESPASAIESGTNPVIVQLAAQVSKANLTGIISDLQNFQTRYASTAACENSGAYLYNAFARMGLQTAYETFQFSGGRHTTRNIAATFPGKTVPNQIVIVGAHYDSYSNQAATNAPGADDNGSGVATVLEIARILTGQSASFDYTVKFVCFSAEEWGLYGSAHYAQAAKSRGESIVGVINLDMIAYPNGIGGKLDLVANRSSEWLADRFASASQIYEGLGTRKVIDSSWKYSDQSSFWDQGYNALCGIEYEDSRNPYYHKTTDTLSTLNMDYATSVTRATLAAAADLAQPVVAVTQYRLTIAAGAGGTTNPVPGTYAYDAGTVVGVTAAASAGFRFAGWSGDASGTSSSINISMNSDKSVAASFVRRQYVLTISAGAGGTTNPVPGTYPYDEGAVVGVTAAPSAGYRFANWSGDASGIQNPIALTMNSNKSVAANFIRIIYPPADLQGQKILNRSLAKSEYINVLKWTAHSGNAGLNLALVRVYLKKGGSLTKIAEQPSGMLSFEHRGAEKSAAYDYVVLFVDSDGREGEPASLTIR